MSSSIKLVSSVASRQQKPLKCLISAPTGGGKTLGALLIAKGITNSGKVLALDTENRRMDLKVGEPLLDGWLWDRVALAPDEVTSHHYIAMIEKAIEEGYEALILDSTTHEWQWILAQWSALGGKWGVQWDKASRPHFDFVKAIIKAPIHIICTARAKMTTEQQTNDATGKKEVVKLGLSNQQEGNFEYDMDFHFRINGTDNYAVAEKQEAGLFDGAFKISTETGIRLNSFLSQGETPAEAKRREQRSRLNELQMKLIGLKLLDKAQAEKEMAEVLSKPSEEVIAYGKSLRAKYDKAIADENAKSGTTPEVAA
jgi:hypothetical protein